MNKKDTNNQLNLFFLRKHKHLYEEICSMIFQSVTQKHILVIEHGDDVLSRQTAEYAQTVSVVDYSKDIRSYELRQPVPRNLRYFLLNGISLPFENQGFDAVVVLNQLPDISAHTMQEIHRVLREDGILIAPAVVHSDLKVSHTLADLTLRKTIAYQPVKKMTKDLYVDYLHQNGWQVKKGKLYKASLWTAYVECSKMNHR
ncbi:MAG: class I SAM-dependent methyltransferase [Oscillospiraceae bacterium]|nr:class I SAM-dependent methyltransferase [Oscillospiraceae bacterium]